jgi:hypothetical protein
MLRALAIATLLAACGGKSNPAPTTDNTGSAPAPTTGGGACVKGGCSGTVCEEAGNDTVTTCEFKPEYACYQSATCERQSDGKCGWTQSDALTQCLANPPKS